MFAVTKLGWWRQYSWQVVFSLSSVLSPNAWGSYGSLQVAARGKVEWKLGSSSPNNTSMLLMTLEGFASPKPSIVPLMLRSWASRSYLLGVNCERSLFFRVSYLFPSGGLIMTSTTCFAVSQSIAAMTWWNLVSSLVILCRANFDSAWTTQNCGVSIQKAGSWQRLRWLGPFPRITFLRSGSPM